MTESPKPERATVMFARIVSKDSDRGEYELEIMGGRRVTLDAAAVEKIEEHIDPVTGIPVAKVTLDSESDLRTVVKARELTQSSDAPFVFGRPQMPQPPEFTPLPDGPVVPGPGNPWDGQQPPVVPHPIPGGFGPLGSGTTCMYNTHTFCKTLFGRAVDDHGGGDMSHDD